jgi:hypothetical protein
MVRLPGIAPGRSPWQEDILLLNHSREIKRARDFISRAHGYYKKEQTPLQVMIAAATGISRWTFRCLGHTSSEALKL